MFIIPLLCLLGTGGANTSIINLWPCKQIFMFFISQNKPLGGALFYDENIARLKTIIVC